jgi:hypothetical protein
MTTTDTTNKSGTTVAKDLRTVSARSMEADAETLWAEIRELAWNYDYPFAARILEVGAHEHWTVTHVALALDHAQMVLSNNHGQDLEEMMAFMNRPIIMNRHCPNRLRSGWTGRFKNRAWVPAPDVRE